MRRPSSSNPQVRHALAEANLAFVRREDRRRVDPTAVFLFLVLAVALVAYLVRA